MAIRLSQLRQLKQWGKNSTIDFSWDAFKSKVERTRTVAEMCWKQVGEAHSVRKQIVMFLLQLLSTSLFFFLLLCCQFVWYQIWVTSWNRYNQSSTKKKANMSSNSELQCECSLRDKGNTGLLARIAIVFVNIVINVQQQPVRNTHQLKETIYR